MKEKASWRRIKAEAGFTLVELIVVIAILGILAGVGTVAYSGYIKKANQAADETLLAAVNSAFAAASTEGGNRYPSAGYAQLNSDGTVNKVTSDVDDGTAFARYYAGNEGSAFKYYKSLGYQKSTGTFYGTDWQFSIDPDTGAYTIIGSNGKPITVSEAARTALLESTYGQTIGIEGLASDVSDLVSAASGVLDAYGGTSVKNWTGMSELITSLGLNADDLSNDELANCVVLYAAKALGNIEMADLLNEDNGTYLDSGMVNVGSLLSTAGYKDGGEITAVQAAVNYAMATAYANSEYGKDAKITVDGNEMTVYDYYNQVNESLSGMNGNDATAAAATMIGVMSGGNFGETTEEWYSYYESGAAEKDLTAFMNTMGAISVNIESIDGQAYTDGGMTGDYMSEILTLLFG